MAIEILNMKKDFLDHPYDFMVDRTSPVGNPYSIRLMGTRDKACDIYEVYAKDAMVRSKAFRDYIHRMAISYYVHGKLRLFCWCAPKRCHAETIARIVESIVEGWADV